MDYEVSNTYNRMSYHIKNASMTQQSSKRFLLLYV